MIPVKLQPEPDDFDALVRLPGNKFLKKLSLANVKLTDKVWNGHKHWKAIQHPLWEAYNGICAYSAQWINPLSYPNVDHFIPKSVKPDLAYEWNNYRLACPHANNVKRDHQDVLDPFKVKKDWFLLDFSSLMVIPNPTLPVQLQQQIQITIDRLAINESLAHVDARSEWIKQYCVGHASFAGLKRYAPFIAYELERQGLVETIKSMMKFEQDEED